MRFADRSHAGRLLAQALRPEDWHDALVVGLPRGGVPVAFEVARALGLELDVIVVRKLGAPFQPELAMGAVGEGGVRVLNDEVIRSAAISAQAIAEAERRERPEVERRALRFRGGRPPASMEGRTVVIVDDGVATGSTARAACMVARAMGAGRVVLAVPVAPRGTDDRFRDVADDVVCLHTPDDFWAVGQFYEDFSQTSDDEVVRLLAEAAGLPAGAAAVPAGDNPTGRDEEVSVPAGPVMLAGHLTVPAGATGIVVFAHGSGSSRHSPRNRYVASVLNETGLGTFLFDLLTVQEEQHRRNVFDIDLLAARLLQVTAWLHAQPQGDAAHVGYFGASTGAAAALAAAADARADVDAVVSRGGRPDLAGALLGAVRTPTLLIVGGWDEVVLELNREAMARMTCPCRLEVVPGATHLFEEPGTLQTAAELARDWFVLHLAPMSATSERPHFQF